MARDTFREELEADSDAGYERVLEQIIKEEVREVAQESLGVYSGDMFS